MKISLGQQARKTVTLGDAEVRAFAEVSGDFNPLHLDEEAARAGIFGRRIVHGMLAAAHFSALIAEQLPGPGSIYLSQSLTFKRPIFVGDSVDVLIEVAELIVDRKRVKLLTRVLRDTEVVIEGEALVLAPESCFEANE